MKLYSLNDQVYFRLTETGRKILADQAERFHREKPSLDLKYAPDPEHGDWYRKQLHWILSHFGGSSMVGTMLPVVDISFEKPYKEARNEKADG